MLVTGCGNVKRVRVVRRGLDDADQRPFGQRILAGDLRIAPIGRYVAPGPPAIVGAMDKAVVGADPEASRQCGNFAKAKIVQ